jgi:hypothetical protein
MNRGGVGHVVHDCGRFNLHVVVGRLLLFKHGLKTDAMQWELGFVRLVRENVKI